MNFHQSSLRILHQIHVSFDNKTTIEVLLHFVLNGIFFSNSTEADDDFRMIDYRPASTVLMQGVDSNAFFNFFVNSSHVLSTVGPLAGIPPTILSPSAFKNSSLRSVNVCILLLFYLF